MASPRVRDILLRITGDASDAQQDFQDLAREMTKFDGTVAEATVDINTTPADRKIEAAKKAVQDFGRLAEEAKVDIQTRAAEVKLNQLRTNLENLQKKPVTPKVELAMGRTVAQIERVEAQLDKLDRRRVDIDVGRGAAGAAVGGIAAGMNAATRGIGLFIAAASSGLTVIGGIGRVFVQLGLSGARLGPIFLALIPVMVAMAASVVLLTGAVVALGASFLTAAAGVGVLGVALVAAFGPVLLVAIAAMARFAKILEAVKFAEEGAADAAERVADAQEQGAERVAAANQAQAAAQRTAVDAAQRVKTTAVDAYRAWAQAAEEVSDAVRGIAQAELSRDQARLNVKQAEQNLRELRKEAGLTSSTFDDLFKKFTDVNADTSGLAAAIKAAGGQAVAGAAGASALDIEQGVLDLQQARLNEKDAIDGVSDAHTRLDEARAREQEFIQNGIKAYEPYTAALQASADAQVAVAAAAEASAAAVAAAAEAVADARRKQAEATKDLTPQERRLVDVLVKLKATLTDLFRPATRAIFDGLLDALEDLADFAKDTGVRRGFTRIGEAIGDMFRTIGRVLRSREFRNAFATFAEGGAKIIRELTPTFRALFRTITRLAETAMPWLLDEIRKIGRRFRDWAGDITRSDIEGFVRRVRRSFTIWKGIVEDVWGVVVDFFTAANEGGDTLAGHIRDILRDFRAWLDENPEGIQDFFKRATTFASDLLTVLEKIVAAMKFIAENPVVVSPVAGVAANTDVFKNIWDAITGNFRGMPKQLGGVIPGTGTGDIVPAMLEPGEFVLRRSVAQAIGIPRLNLLNAGGLAAAGGGGRGHYTHIDQVVLPPAPGHDQLGDPRVQAAMFARELARRGGTPVHR